MKYIKDHTALKEFCKEIERDQYITFDTEFIRESTYKPELCLIQVSGEDNVALIDVLEFSDHTPLIVLFQDKKIMKVCHSGQQDLEIFYDCYGIVPAPLHDTQIIAMCVGYGENIGYQSLVSDLCDIRLNKELQLTNWKKRPLTQKQKNYAADDVIHLRKVYETLRKKMQLMQRESWIEEEIIKLTDPSRYKFNPENGWKRIKLKRHNQKQLSVAKLIAIWREEQAANQNKNRARIISDEAIYELSVVQPKQASQLSDLRKINSGHIKKYGAVFLDLIKTALEVPDSQMPKMPIKPVVTDAHQNLSDLMKLLLKVISNRYEVASKLISNAKDIDRFVLGQEKDDTPEFMKGWRYEIYGKVAQDLMNGKLYLRYEDGKIIFEQAPALQN